MIFSQSIFQNPHNASLTFNGNTYSSSLGSRYTQFLKLCAFFLLFTLFTPISVHAESENTLSSATMVEKVNINTADKAELSSRLFGIGESKAQAIVDHREQVGEFKTINELILVRGIGEKTIAENRHLLSVSNE